jgi:2,3-diketo-5-methylthio-1-phosphopentane phosphatase
MRCDVLVDFDGTIATEDTTDLLLERFALPEWQEIEADWKAGRIGSRECMLRQIDLVRATPEQIETFILGLTIDPDFPRFVRLCREHGHEVTVVSDGLDRTVGSVLSRFGIELPLRANKLEWIGADRWRLSFPHARSDCRSLSGNCKCQFTEGAAGLARIVVGDGRSDFCVAGRADLVLSKASLTKHCRDNGIPHVAFSGFAEAIDLFCGWLEERLETGAGQEA